MSFKPKQGIVTGQGP